MHKLVAGLFSALLPMLFSAPAEADSRHHLRGPEQCVVSSEDMEMILIRRQPATYAFAETRVYPGECRVELLGRCRGDWCPVRQGAFSGWIRKHNLRPASPPVYCVDRIEFHAMLDLQAIPSKSSRVVGRVRGDFCGIVVLAGGVGHWRHVRAGRLEGWVSVSHLRLP